MKLWQPYAASDQQEIRLIVLSKQVSAVMVLLGLRSKSAETTGHGYGQSKNFVEEGQTKDS